MNYDFLTSPTLSTYANVVGNGDAPNMMNTGYASGFDRMVQGYNYPQSRMWPYGAGSSTAAHVSQFLADTAKQMRQNSNSNLYGGGDIMANGGTSGLIAPSGAYQVSGNKGGLWNL